MPAEGRENPLLKKGNSDAFFREKYLTKNNPGDMVIQQLPKTVGAVKRKDQNAYRGESDLLREYEFTNLCVFAAQRFFIILLWQYTQNE